MPAESGNRNAPRWVVVADDLTGACDTGIQFVGKGFRAVVSVLSGEITRGPASAGVWVVDTESRNADAAEAASRLSRLGEVLRPLVGRSVFYKKVDSTLRGNIGAETRALREALGLEKVFFQPAFPKIGRTTVNGELLLNGVPVHLTDIGKDPLKPVSTSSLRDIFYVFCGLCGDDARLSDVCLWSDARTEGELRDAAGEILKTRRPEDVLWTGSAGLALALTELLPPPGRDSPERTAVGPAPAGSLLGFVGSFHPRNAGQIERARRERGVEVCAPDIREVVENPLAAAEKVSREIGKAVEAGRDLLVATALTPRQREEKERLGAEAPDRVSAFLALVCGETVRRNTKVGGLYLTGGEVAARIFSTLGAGEIVPLREVEPGIPLLRLNDGAFKGPVVTKAGAFGSDGCVGLILDALRGGRG
jgi:uncharacterized protein YgbK (DUF1537 family)